MKALPLSIVFLLIVPALAANQRAWSADDPEEPTKPSIYKCITAGRVTYSDTACKNAGEKDKVIVKEANSYTPEAYSGQGESDSDRSQRSSEAREQSAIAKTQAAQQERCKQLGEQLEASKQTERNLMSKNAAGSYVVMDQSRRVAELAKEYGAAGCT